jgi:hypothetical protein
MRYEGFDFFAMKTALFILKVNLYEKINQAINLY